MAVEALENKVDIVFTDIPEDTIFDPLEPFKKDSKYTIYKHKYGFDLSIIPDTYDKVDLSKNSNEDNRKYAPYIEESNGRLLGTVAGANNNITDIVNGLQVTPTWAVDEYVTIFTTFNNVTFFNTNEYLTADITVLVRNYEDGVLKDKTFTKNYTIYDGLANHGGITPKIYYKNGKLYVFNQYTDRPLLISRKGLINSELIVDDRNITAATSPNTMNVVVKATNKFNSFTLSNVIGELITYRVVDENGIELHTSSKTIDCYIDDGKIGEQVGITVMLPAFREIVGGKIIDRMVGVGGEITVNISNTNGKTQLGTITSNIAIETEDTHIVVNGAHKDYNLYKADPFGQIQEAVKPIINTSSTTNYGEYKKVSRALSRYKNHTGKFMTYDPTNYYLDNPKGIPALVARGIISLDSYSTIEDKGHLDDIVRYKVSFREII